MTPTTASVHLSRAVRSRLWDTSDWLGGWWPTVALSVLAVLLAVVLVARLRRSSGARAARAGSARRNRWPAVLLGGGLTVALSLTGLTAANAVSGYVPSVDALGVQLSSVVGGGAGASAAGPGETSTVAQVHIPAPVADHVSEDQAWVYTPPGYGDHPGQRYPVAYLLHGYPGHAPDWFAAAGIAHQMDVLVAAHLVRPMIVVAPDVNGEGVRDSECLNAIGGPQVETYLDDVVVPFVDARYRTQADWRHRVIGGMSSGGFCALDQGLRHPALYGSIIALEPYGDPGSGGRAAFDGDASAVAAHSPSTYLPTLVLPHPLSVFIDEGSRAAPADARGARLVATELRARGAHVTTRVEAGDGHSWLEASEGIPYGLVMASRAMPAQ